MPPPLPAPLVFFKEPISDTLDDVWGMTGEVYAVGYNGTIVHDRGTGTFFRERISTTLEFYSVWGLSATDVYVGIAGGKLGHASGAGSWTRRDLSGISGPVYQVFGFSPDDLYLTTGALYRGTLNSTWKKVDQGPPANSIWGSSPNDLYTVATASLDQPNIYHSTGDGKWRSQATTGEYMSRVFGLDARHVYAIGSHSVWFSAGDGAWRSVLTLTGDAPISLWGRDGLVYVGTQSGKLYVTNTAEFTAGQAIGTSTTGPRITGIWAASPTNVYLATSGGLYHGTPDGKPPVTGAGGAGGAVGGTGGASGTYSTDPSTFGGAARCSPNAVLCEDFETGNFGGDWTKLSDVTVDTGHAMRGTYALHVHNAGAFGGGTISSWKAFPRPRNRFWLRMFVYFQTLPAPSEIGPWALVRAQNAVPATGGVSLSGSSDGTGSHVL
ncbi:MAG TPA: hypothetical protein VHU40_20045, partial [Polyangia bacterium]|nr:hypothetical protein [Polyangia bacterium]